MEATRIPDARRSLFRVVQDHSYLLLLPALLPGFLYQYLPPGSVFCAPNSNGQTGFAAVAAGLLICFLSVSAKLSRVKLGQLVVKACIVGSLGVLALLFFQELFGYFRSLSISGDPRTMVLVVCAKFIVWSYGSYFDPYAGALPSMIAAVGSAGICEEACKGFLVIIQPEAKKSWRAAFLFGIAAGVGFTIGEGVWYSITKYNGVNDYRAYFIRFFSWQHGFWTASTALLYFLRTRKNLFWALMPQAILHGLFNGFVKMGNGTASRNVSVISFVWMAMLVWVALGRERRKRKILNEFAGAGLLARREC